MRRGHPGIGGWRSENPRHFKPRGPGGPRFRTPRPYSPLENPPFPPIPRPHRPSQHYNTHSGQDNHGPSDHPGLSDHHDRSKYRINNQRNMDRGPHPRTRPNYPPYQNMRQVDNDIQESTYKNSSNFYKDKDKYHVNNMGDIDHRLTPHGSFNEPYSQQLPQMSNPPPGLRKQYFEDRNLQKNYRHETGDGNQIPLEYAGHRPPASDHYGTPSTMANNNNTAFSRSVDDTVDIIRKRMLNRNESLPLLQDSDIQDNNDQQTRDHANQLSQPEQRAKKRPPRQRQTVKANCDKMKTNIVQQLFKMDKDRIHKLMDNPSSSTKFEYAISSLITESQNSLNQHMRSVAEKSLSSTSTDFMQSDNNTIYEDTFMKQMQGLLDPQDTVLLEDIKPLVMAELSKVLQLNDFDHRFEVPDDSFAMLPVQDEQSNYPYDTQYHYDDYYYNRPYDQDEQSNFEHADRVNIPDEVNPDFNFINEPPPEQDKPLFERRTARKSNQSDHSEEKKLSAEQRRMSLERRRLSSEVHTNEETEGLFDTNTEQQSEEDDPFAELDRQYHVAVDHNFIANEDLSARNTPNNMQVIQKDSIIKTELDELQTIIPPSKYNISSKDSHDKRPKSNTNIKLEVLQSPDFPKENSTPHSYTENINPIEHVPIKQEYNRGVITTDKSTENQDNLNVSKTSPSNSRKRSIDQRPSHRKEKRKKSESSLSTESAKSSNGKIDSVNEEPRRLTEKCKDDTKPPYYNIFTIKSSNKETSKDNKHADIADKNYSDKYVKRKETHKKSKEKESYSSRKRYNSTSYTILSPKDSNNQTSKDSNSQTPSKSDPKTKLKHIDMFSEKTKKVTLHQAHRNTTSMTPKHSSDDNKPKTTPMRKSAATKHVSTQVLKKVTTRETQTFESKSVSSRFSQTERKKTITRFAQTDPVAFEKPPEKPRSSDAFERMKEIDMEIQVLLQEKFKLYSSLESKESCSSSMPTLGMTVLNVAPVEEIKEEEEDLDSDSLISADNIVDDFTNIPVEELEQIALETVQEESTTPKIEKKNLRQKVLQRERKTSESPTSSRRNKKGKTPNISLIEQIITDERPLDDIICLDDLEKPENKNKKKKQGSKALNKKKVTKKTQKSVDPPIHYDLKECSVVLIQTDVTQFLRNIVPEAEEMVVDVAPDAIPQYLEEPPKTEYSSKATEVVEEAVVNDMNLDMLDVSEDIVIGDICEIKCQDGKDVHETIDLSLNLNEDIILDNSQLSAEDAVANEAGQSDVCKMYDYSTDEKLRRDSLTVTGNSDAVLAIECIENGFIAACLDGNVYHFSLDGQLLNTMRGSSLAVTCLTIVKEKYGTTVYTGSLDSRIRYYDLETGLEKGPECNVLSPIQTMDRAWDTVFVGTRTGFVLQFECKNNMLIPVSTVKFSEQTILALRAMKEGPRKVLLVAARSEPVTIKDAQTGLLLRTLVGPKMTVYSLMFEDGKVYCGTSSHQIHVYDYSTGQHAGCHEGGKGAVCLRATGGLLFAGCYDGCVYIYREGETRPLAQLRGPSLMLLSLAVIGSKIIAGYKDRSVYIWKIPLSVLQEMIL